MALEMTESRVGKRLVLKFVGRIDESAHIPPFPTVKETEIELDVKGVVSLNSVGIREWIIWLNTIPKDKQIIYSHCPPIFVEQMMVFMGFLPRGTVVESVYIPYYCESCNYLSHFLADPSKEGSDPLSISHFIPCEKCGKNAEIDVDRDEYLLPSS